MYDQPSGTIKENSKARNLGKTRFYNGKVNLGETRLRFPHGFEFWLFVKSRVKGKQ